ncbi:HNH endonuclease [Sinorhizobium meliloti]|uniref:HNH endonuclease n=1 Tax=Rhizobium meliloti TaxID=382 RepID=UPI000FD88A67|nr:HNH endonuclease [Sinorhizobium meliloti]
MAKPRKRDPIPQGVRFDVFRRDNFTCVYCGRGSPEVTLHCDHVEPHSKGGSDDKSNLVTACQDCNYGKGVKSVRKASVGRSISASNDNSGLVGLYGHTRDDDGAINWQFEVMGKITEDTYTIQLFSWLDGGPTDVKMVSLEVLRGCSLYSTKDDWLWAWAKESASRDGRDRKWAEGTFYLSTGRRYGEAA